MCPFWDLKYNLVFRSILLYYILLLCQIASLPTNLATDEGLTARFSSVARSSYRYYLSNKFAKFASFARCTRFSKHWCTWSRSIISRILLQKITFLKDCWNPKKSLICRMQALLAKLHFTKITTTTIWQGHIQFCKENLLCCFFKLIAKLY